MSETKFYANKFLDSRQKVLDRMVASISPLNFSWTKFLAVTVVPKCLNCDTFSNDLFVNLMP
jgi:hypothetical protein